MIITIHLSDGRKITQDTENLLFFRSDQKTAPKVCEGCITVNADHVTYMHTPDEDELKHMENHGW